MGTLDVDGSQYEIGNLIVIANKFESGDESGLSVDVITESGDIGVTLNSLRFFGVVDIAELFDRDLVLGEQRGVELGESVFVSPDHETLEIDELTVRLITKSGALVEICMYGYCQDHFGNKNLPVQLAAPSTIRGN